MCQTFRTNPPVVQRAIPCLFPGAFAKQVETQSSAADPLQSDQLLIHSAPQSNQAFHCHPTLDIVGVIEAEQQR